MTLLVDSHCHLDRLDLAPFGGSLVNALDYAREHGVGHFLCVAIGTENWSDVLAIARDHADVYATIGVHPNEEEADEPDLDRLLAAASADEVVAIGETGLDYFRSEGDLAWQRERFRTHIQAAKACGKPLVVHSREARDDTLRILKEEGAETVSGVMHCFVEDWATAERAMELGFYISFSGIVTFRNAEELKAVAARVPAERLLVETDAPYLAPVPHRGKSNQPAYVRYVAEHIAELRGVSLEEIAASTTENFFRLFKIHA